MASNPNAKDSRFDLSPLELDMVWGKLTNGLEWCSAETARQGEALQGSARRDGGQAEPSAGRQGPHSEPYVLTKEAQSTLQSYLEKSSGPAPSGFAPFETLSARLGEFSEPLEQQSAEQARSADAWQTAGTPSAHFSVEKEAPSPKAKLVVDLVWFEEKFNELKDAVSHSEATTQKIETINERLGEVISRVDLISATMPQQEATLDRVESKLGRLSQSFETSKLESFEQSERIARAAAELLHAVGAIETNQRRMEAESQSAFAALNAAVGGSAARAAELTASQISVMLRSSPPPHDFSKVESLAHAAKEACERSAKALGAVHGTLRDYLERGAKRSEPLPGGHTQVRPPSEPHSGEARRRVNLQMPIKADAEAFSKAKPKAAAPKGGDAQHLDRLTTREPDRVKTKLEQEIEEMLAKDEVKQQHKAPAAANRGASAAKPEKKEAAPAPLSQRPRDEEAGVSIKGIAIVAFVLLLASGALFYLNMRSKRDGQPPAPANATMRRESSVLPEAKRAELRPGVIFETEFPVKIPKDLPSLSASVEASRTTLKVGNGAIEGAQPPLPMDDIEKLALAASNGDQEAEYQIGLRFLGEVGDHNAKAAARWLMKAARSGHTEAQFLLGTMLESGIGSAKNEQEAAALYEKAAEAGHPKSMHNLAVLLCNRADEPDYQRAAHWFAKAAERGVAESEYNLAVLLERGIGLPQDLARAYFWYSVAARNGDAEAKIDAQRVQKNLHSQQASLLEQDARNWRPGSPPHPDQVWQTRLEG